MKKILLFSFLFFLITSCFNSSEIQKNISGTWIDEQNHLYYLDKDGSLALPGQTSVSGIRWQWENDVLILETMNTAGTEIKERKLVLKHAGTRSLEFTDTDGSLTIWKKSRATIGKLEGSLFYRERIALPPEFVISVQLYPLHSSIPTSVAVTPSHEPRNLNFKIYYLEQTISNQMRVAASILNSGETLFSTKEDIIVSPHDTPSIMLYKNQPGEKQLSPLIPPVSYEGTLKKNGNELSIHLYLEKGGLALLTHEEDLNPSMGTWMEKDRNRTIEISRGTQKPVTATRGNEEFLLLEGLSPQAIELKKTNAPWPDKNIFIEGELRNVNGAPLFSECNTQRDISLLSTGKNYDKLTKLSLENNTSTVVLEGRLQNGSLDASRLFLVQKGGLCSAEQYASVPLLQTYWRLRELNGIQVKTFSDQPEPHLILRDKGQASGSDGCNNFFIGWKKENNSITFSAGGTTLRICPQGNEQAMDIHKMFAETDEWSINGSMLEFRSQNRLVAVFESVNM